ncbi:MAG: DinB family protein, partial [Bacteroidota bacterium]
MNKDALFIKMVISAWQTQNARVDKLLETLSDEQLSAQTAPGRNSGTYLLGHLATVNDGLFPLLGFGERLHPELENIFLTNPDNANLPKPTLAELKKYWKEINTKLTQHINETHPDEWLTRHSAVSEEDFAKEPHRNKLNIIINRTNHQSYHIGQMT